MSLKQNDIYLESMRVAYENAMDDNSTPHAVSILHSLIVMGYGKEANTIETEYNK